MSAIVHDRLAPESRQPIQGLSWFVDLHCKKFSSQNVSCGLFTPSLLRAPLDATCWVYSISLPGLRADYFFCNHACPLESWLVVVEVDETKSPTNNTFREYRCGR